MVLRRLHVGLAGVALMLAACGPGEPASVTLSLCDDIPGAISEMQRQRDRLTDGQFGQAVTTVVTDTHDLLEPLFADARRVVGAEDYEPYEKVGGYVQGAWRAYVEMDTLDPRSGYMDYGEAIYRMGLAEGACEELSDHY
jgi:hypothetical protein